MSENISDCYICPSCKGEVRKARFDDNVGYNIYRFRCVKCDTWYGDEWVEYNQPSQGEDDEVPFLDLMRCSHDSDMGYELLQEQPRAYNASKCKYCAGDIMVSQDQLIVPTYHKACAWYELPCDICGKPMAIHREWVTPPKAHKACKDAIKSKWYEKPCDYCGRPLRVPINAVLIPKFHKKCAAKAKEVISSVKSATGESLNVFLCHSSSDKLHVRKLFQRLRSAGVTPWLDEENLLPGQDWHYEIIKAVRNSHAVIVCLSKSSINKAGYIQKEIKHALDVADEQPEGTIFLIPLKLEDCETPDRLKRWQWVNLFDQVGYDKLFCALSERARGLGMLQVAKLIKPEASKENSKATIEFLEKLNKHEQGMDTFDFLYSVKSDFDFRLWDPTDPWENIDGYLSKLHEMGLIKIDNKIISVTDRGRAYIDNHRY